MSSTPLFESFEKQQPSKAPASLDAVLRINAIVRRPPRITDIAAEQAMHGSIASMVERQPDAVPQAVVDAALGWCGAGSAGLSRLERYPDGTSRFRWKALAGRLANLVDYSLPGDFSPCHVCLDRDEPVLFAFPERRFVYLQGLGVAFVETVTVPMHIGGRPAGTLWVVAHAVGRRFDTGDVEILTRLASAAGLAYARMT